MNYDTLINTSDLRRSHRYYSVITVNYITLVDIGDIVFLLYFLCHRLSIHTFLITRHEFDKDIARGSPSEQRPQRGLDPLGDGHSLAAGPSVVEGAKLLAEALRKEGMDEVQLQRLGELVEAHPYVSACTAPCENTALYRT